MTPPLVMLFYRLLKTLLFSGY